MYSSANLGVICEKFITDSSRVVSCLDFGDQIDDLKVSFRLDVWWWNEKIN